MMSVASGSPTMLMPSMMRPSMMQRRRRLLGRRQCRSDDVRCSGQTGGGWATVKTKRLTRSGYFCIPRNLHADNCDPRL
jgi:hypothetical protein